MPDKSIWPYTHARDGILDMDILLWKGETPVSRAIRTVTKSDYSHASFCRWDCGRLMHFEALLSGTSYNRLSWSVKDYRGAVIDIYRLEFYPDLTKLYQAALGLLNHPYDNPQIPKILINTLFGEVLKEPNDSLKALICSEYLSYCYRSAGVDLVEEKSDSYTTPGDIARSPKLEKIMSMRWPQPPASIHMEDDEN